jgi:hypothetical protein
MTYPPAILRATLCVVGAAVSSASAQGEWVLIDRDLHEQRVELTQIQGGVVSFVDLAGLEHERPVSALLAAIPNHPPEDRPPRELPWITKQMELFGQGPTADSEAESFTGELTLTDGQRWIGTLVSVRGESITWLLESSLVLEAPLDEITSAEFRAILDHAALDWAGLDDRVLLRNGDTLDGFVARVDPGVRVETATGNVDLALERVAGLLLANPPTTPTGTILRTAEGSVIEVIEVDITVTGAVSSRVGGDAALGDVSLRTTELTSLLFAPGSIGALATMEPTAVISPAEQPWSRPPVTISDDTLGVESLELQGPVRVEWTLPKPARRFSTTATLPPAMWAWGDCEVVVYAGDGDEAFRERLNADRPSVHINLPMGGVSTLAIEIDSGRGGPVQDRVIFTRPMVTWR